MAEASERDRLVHELNNALSAIAGYAEFVLARLPKDAALRDQVTEIREAGLRAARIARALSSDER